MSEDDRDGGRFEDPAVSEEPTSARSAPWFWIGVDCYPLDEERRSPDEWYARDLDEDFAAMAAARVGVVRLFCSWRCLEPQVGQYDEEMFERLDGVIDAARRHGLDVIVCLFADDRLSELTDVVWGKGRDPRTDEYLLQRETALVQRIVNRYRQSSAIIAWDLANEAFCTRFRSEEDLERWVLTLREAIREIDTERPIMLSIDPETFMRETGIDARSALDLAEMVVSHLTAPYRAYVAEGPVTFGPSTYIEGFLVRSAARDLPVIADGIGVESLDHSVGEEATCVRTALYSALMNRARGVMLRRWRDLETERREPYFRDPFEALVGVVDAQGEPKPVLKEVSAFAQVVARIDPERYALAPERAAVFIPAERYEPLPSLAGLYGPRAYLQSYIAAKEAGIPAALLREGDPMEAHQALFVPSAMRLAPETWRALAAFVQGGGSVVLSYGGGDADPAVREIFGVEFLGDAGPRERLSCRVAQAGVLGGLRSFDARMRLPHHATLSVRGALVIATDATGSPLVTLHEYGQGKAVLIATPVERALAQNDPWAAPEEVRRLLREVYGAIGRAAGAGAMVRCDTAEVEVAHLLGEEDDIVIAMRHNDGDGTVTLSFERVVARVSDVRGGQPVEVDGASFGVPLGPNGVATLRVAYAR